MSTDERERTPAELHLKTRSAQRRSVEAQLEGDMEAAKRWAKIAVVYHNALLKQYKRAQGSGPYYRS